MPVFTIATIVDHLLVMLLAKALLAISASYLKNQPERAVSAYSNYTSVFKLNKKIKTSTMPSINEPIHPIPVPVAILLFFPASTSSASEYHRTITASQ